MKHEPILIVGSQNADERDRTLDRKQIRTVQLSYGENQIESINFFNDWGKLGVSSICWFKDKPLEWFVALGSEMFTLNLKDGSIKPIEIDRVKDIHEISIIGDDIWISNTYYDELLAYNPKQSRVTRRLKLNASKDNLSDITNTDESTLEAELKNKFHTNQVFQSYEGHLFALVHHVDGEQIIKRVAQKLIKSQGNGGVFNLENGNTTRLKLKAPHSVRLINNQYWIFDSGHAQLNIYDRNWTLLKEVSMAGWGRGGDFSDTTMHYYAGVSAKRKRYLTHNDQNLGANMVQIFDSNAVLLNQYEVLNIEQVNNIYLLSNEQISYLKRL